MLGCVSTTQVQSRMRVENSAHSLASVRRMSDLIRQRDSAAYCIVGACTHVHSLPGSAVILSPAYSFGKDLNQKSTQQGKCLSKRLRENGPGSRRRLGEGFIKPFRDTFAALSISK